MELMGYKIEIKLKNFNFYSIVSLLMLILGILFYIQWGTRYGIWYDIGIYSVVIIFVLAGIIGFILSLTPKQEE
ncbi:MAG: hypothetical protein V5A64_02500 [Candidatus Thermoplasmatota archaeon]